MNARDYLAKQGISLDRDEAKPQSLEEKAWARAQAAAEHGPRSGTPHDWEDWERHHEALASNSESLVTKKRKRHESDDESETP
ncbi:hypothetical protein [Salinicola halophilus]|uniref:hypothetical protein n=1 Tax=Salinicola halophilus TaxID=184065 RepID=UPI000DA16383|nr:hypothetical protein [Salinicola halophilus]